MSERKELREKFTEIANYYVHSSYEEVAVKEMMKAVDERGVGDTETTLKSVREECFQAGFMKGADAAYDKGFYDGYRSAAYDAGYDQGFADGVEDED